MSFRDPDSTMAFMNRNYRKDKRTSFSSSLIAHVDINTGVGFCNIREYWEGENVTSLPPEEELQEMEAVS